MRWLLAALLCLATPWLSAAAATASATLELRYRDQAGVWQQYQWRGELELADTPELREKGLMGRSSLDAGHGMLFLYPESQDLWFWMKNTTVPLTALGLDRQCRIVSARPLIPLSTETLWLGRGQRVLELPRIPALPDIAFGSRHVAGSLRVSGSHPMLDPGCQLP